MNQACYDICMFPGIIVNSLTIKKIKISHGDLPHTHLGTKFIHSNTPKPYRESCGHRPSAQLQNITTISQGGRQKQTGVQSLWAGAPQCGHLVDLVEHAVQTLENKDESWPHRFWWPVGDGQHFGDVASQATALHGQSVVRCQFQERMCNLCQPR